MTSIVDSRRVFLRDPIARSSTVRRSLALAVASALVFASGCGTVAGNRGPAASPAVDEPSITISGSVRGGQQPLANATIQLYATGTGGDGSASAALLSTPAKADETGAFTLTNVRPCPSSAGEVYLVASGGSPADLGGGANPNASLMTLLGPCGTLASAASLHINEITTIASVYAVAAYMSGPAAVGFGATDAQAFSDSLHVAGQLANLTAGSSPGTVPAGQAAPVAKLNTLANIVSSCVDSAGGSAGDGSACGDLFQYAGTQTAAPVKDTLSAVLAIANAPTENVNSLYALAGAANAFQPVLGSAPADWTLALVHTPAAPTFSPAAGSYSSAQTVTLADADAGAVLYYTTDGTTPTTSSNRYSGGISVSSSATVRAIAVDEGLSSEVASAAYTIDGPPAPEFSPDPATYSSVQSVTLADADAGAAIYYTTDGSTPSASSTRYGSPISLSATTTLRAIAIDESMRSPVTTRTYVLTPPPPPVFSPSPGSYLGTQTVAISDSSQWAAIYYTTDGSTPTSASTRYTGPITVSVRTTIRALATIGRLNSAAVSGTWNIAAPPAPTFSPSSGSYPSTQSVTLSDGDPSAILYYTIDGSTPSASSLRYSGPITVSATTTLRALAIDKKLNSPVATATYTLTPPPTPLFSPAPGNYTGAQKVTISVSSPSAVVYYTTDGSTPTSSSRRYTEPVVLSTSTTVKAIAIAGNLRSTIASGTWTLAAPPAPTFSPKPETCYSSRTVTLSDTDSFAALYYTTDGSTPSAASKRYAGPISVSASTTIRALAIDGSLSSPVVSGTWTITAPPAPRFTPSPGSYTTAQSVTLSDTDASAVLHYTTDGSTPSASSPLYSGAIRVTASTTIRAIAVDGNLSGPVATGAYTLTPPATPTFSPAPGSYFGTQTVAITDASPSAVVYYTTDGATPTASSTRYSGAITLSASATLRAIAIAGTLSSAIANGSYSLAAPPPPVFSPAPGSYNSAQRVTLSDSDPAAVLYYTTDGSMPSATSERYAGPIPVAASETLRAIAVDGGLSSPVIAAVFSIVPTAPVTIAVTPAAITLAANATQQFAASVNGTSNLVVTWTVTGSDCSGAQCGTITANGLYTAPSVIPASSTVTIIATAAADPSQHASVTVALKSAAGKTYYLAPAAGGGSDANDGTTATRPWLTPNHPGINCGDVLVAAPGAYAPSSFGSGSWHTVNCPAGNSVAWVKCATFDQCTVPITDSDGFHIDQSYWGVQGFEVDGHGAKAGGCFVAYADYYEIHHIIFADNVANGCGANGISSSYGVDYFTVVGNIVFDAAQNPVFCGSGISVYEPLKSDSLPGTHIYIAGNLSYGNFDANPCDGTAPTDGNGVIFDTFDGSQTGLPAYDQQAVMDNNLLIGNGGRGLEVFNNSHGAGPWAHIYTRHNTTWGNNRDTNPVFEAAVCAETLLADVKNLRSSQNIAASATRTGCNGGNTPITAISMSNGDLTDNVDQTVAYSVAGSAAYANSSPGFSYGPNNLFDTDPKFANPVIPPAPSCRTFSDVPGCMADLLADFTPSPQYQTYGAQPVRSGNTDDPLFPAWLCSADLPKGLVTMGCAASSTSSGTTVSPSATTKPRED